MTSIVKEKSKQVSLYPWVALLIGVSAGTFAAPFIKLALQSDIPASVIPFSRMGLAAIILTPLVLTKYRQELSNLTGRDLVMAIFGGIFLLTHFLFLTFALDSAAVLIVLVITNTGPLWVAILERIFLKGHINRYVWLGMVITIVGGIFIAVNANNASEATDNSLLLGVGLSLFAAFAGAAYLVVGRSVRQKVSLFPYVWIVFGSGGVIGLVIVILMGVPILGHPSEGYFWLIMLTFIPQLIGHSGFNFALGYLSATITSLSSQLLTITASIAAFFLFAEVPTIADIIGSVIIAIGVVIAIVYRSKGVSSTPKVQS